MKGYSICKSIREIETAKESYILYLEDGWTVKKSFIPKAIKTGADVVYADELLEDRAFYKPDYSPHTLDSLNYIGPALIKTSVATEHLKEDMDYHRLLRAISLSGCSFKHITGVYFTTNRAISGITSPINDSPGKISIIIPSKDNLNCLRDCITSVRDNTTGDYEIIVVDNGSNRETLEAYKSLADKYIYEKADFNFSHMCNLGTQAAEGEYLIFLNDDIVVADPLWVGKLTAIARDKRSGTVGAKLLYPNDNRIQHCGVIAIGNGPVHAFIGSKDTGDIYFGRNRYTYNYLAVTAACMCIRRDIFPGFNEELPIAYNDVELSFRLYKMGYYNAVVNDIRIYHCESATRGNDLADRGKYKRLIGERHKLYRLHPEFRFHDPFYNSYLSGLRADFSERQLPLLPLELVRRLRL